MLKRLLEYNITEGGSNLLLPLDFLKFAGTVLTLPSFLSKKQLLFYYFFTCFQSLEDFVECPYYAKLIYNHSKSRYNKEKGARIRLHLSYDVEKSVLIFKLKTKRAFRFLVVGPTVLLICSSCTIFK